MDMLKVERIGGLAGFGGARSRLKSEGQIALSALSLIDQKAVDALFKAKDKNAPSPIRDGFSYRVTRGGDVGSGAAGDTILVPEDKMPAALIACVKDRIV